MSQFDWLYVLSFIIGGCIRNRLKRGQVEGEVELSKTQIRFNNTLQAGIIK